MDAPGSAGKFQRLADAECPEFGRVIRKIPSRDSYDFEAAPTVHADAALLPSPFEDSAGLRPLGIRRLSGPKRKSATDVEPESGSGLSNASAPANQSGPLSGASSGMQAAMRQGDACLDTAMNEGLDHQSSALLNIEEQKHVQFSSDTTLTRSFQRSSSSIQRKATPGVALMSELADFAADTIANQPANYVLSGNKTVDMDSSEEGNARNHQSPHGRGVVFMSAKEAGVPNATAVRFSNDTKTEPTMQRSGSSIQRKGTPGLSLMSDLADMAEDVCSDTHGPASVRFSEDTKTKPDMQRTESSLQRKGTPGLALKSDLADMAADTDGDMYRPASVRFSDDSKAGPSMQRSESSIQCKGTPGVGLMSDLADIAAVTDDDMRGQASVRFSRDTKPGPTMQRSGSSIQRKGTPGVALMSDIADIAAEVNGEKPKAAAVHFSKETNPEPSMQRTGSSIQRKGTPGLALLSDLADIAAEAHNESQRPGSVHFGEETKAGPSMHRLGSSIQRKGTPGAALMSDLSDMAAETDNDDSCGAAFVRFSEGTKPGPSLNRSGSSIQRKGTPGVALLSDIADIAAEIDDEMKGPAAVHFSADTKTGPSLQHMGPSIRRQGTPGVGLMADLADTAADIDDFLHGPASVHFSEDTKTEPSMQRTGSSIQRKGTPGVALMSDVADFAREVDEEMKGPAEVHFSMDMKAGPSLQHVGSSIRRKGTPGVGLMANLADMAPDIDDFSCGPASVHFSEDTNSEPSMQRTGSSIRRKGTPGVALMSDLADFAADLDEDMQGPPSVRFSEGTKAEHSMERTVSSIQRKGTPGVGLMSDLASYTSTLSYDQPGEVTDMAGSPLGTEMTTNEASGVRFDVDSKPGPSLQHSGSSIQRRATPGMALMSQLTDMTEDLTIECPTDDLREVHKSPSARKKISFGQESSDISQSDTLNQRRARFISDVPSTSVSPKRAGSAMKVGIASSENMFDSSSAGMCNQPRPRTVGAIKFTEDTKTESISEQGDASLHRRGTPGLPLKFGYDHAAEDSDTHLRGNESSSWAPSQNQEAASKPGQKPLFSRSKSLNNHDRHRWSDADDDLDRLGDLPQRTPVGTSDNAAHQLLRSSSSSRAEGRSGFSLAQRSLVQPADLGSGSAEISAIFSRPSVGDNPSNSLIAPVARRGRVTSLTGEIDDPLVVVPRMRSADMSSTQHSFLASLSQRTLRRTSAQATYREDANMEDLTAAMAELGHATPMQRD